MLNFLSESLNASMEPSTSPLMMRFSSLNSPTSIRRPNSSSVTVFCVRTPCSRCSCWRLVAMARAVLLVFEDVELVPGIRGAIKAKHGHRRGRARSSTRWPRSLNMALTWPLCWPASMASPTFKVPASTNTLVT